MHIMSGHQIFRAIQRTSHACGGNLHRTPSNLCKPTEIYENNRSASWVQRCLKLDTCKAGKQALFITLNCMPGALSDPVSCDSEYRSRVLCAAICLVLEGGKSMRFVGNVFKIVMGCTSVSNRPNHFKQAWMHDLSHRVPCSLHPASSG